MRAWPIATLAVVLALACGHSEAGPIFRDWTAHPAIVQFDDADEIFALSDPHGGLEALVMLLTANHIIGQAGEWTAGKATLVVAGDLIDKGPDSLGVIDLLRVLERGAKARGGRVVVTMGNHEAEFFVDPSNKKAMSTGEDANGIDNQLVAKSIKPEDLAVGTDSAGRGRWLLDLPFGVRIKGWFFAHGGNTGGDSIPVLARRLQTGFEAKGFAATQITGDDSILESQTWYGDPDSDIGSRYAKALGVKHIVFGHDPHAFHVRGQIRVSKDGSLVAIDVDMGLHKKGAATGGLLLHITTKGKDTAEVLDAKGHGEPLL